MLGVSKPTLAAGVVVEKGVEERFGSAWCRAAHFSSWGAVVVVKLLSSCFGNIQPGFLCQSCVWKSLCYGRNRDNPPTVWALASDRSFHHGNLESTAAGAKEPQETIACYVLRKSEPAQPDSPRIWDTRSAQEHQMGFSVFHHTGKLPET